MSRVTFREEGEKRICLPLTLNWGEGGGRTVTSACVSGKKIDVTNLVLVKFNF